MNNKEHVKVYLQTHLLMQEFIFKKVFANQFYNQSDSVVLRKITVELPDSPSAVAQAHNHTHNPKDNSRQETSQPKH
jgi:hypothetical protein